MNLVPKPLIRYITNNQCLPFIGAGFSVNAELSNDETMPGWDNIIDQLLSELQQNKPDKNNQDYNLLVAQEYEKTYGINELIEKVRSILHIDEARPGEVHKKFAKIPFDIVYTTNFDSLLEDAYTEVNKIKKTNFRPHRVLVGDNAISSLGGNNITNIIKMHGDFSHHDEFTITKKHYDEYLENHKIISTNLSNFLITKTALFIGYSLRDPHLNHLMKIVNERLGKFMRKPYIVLFDDNKASISEFKKRQFYVIKLSLRNKNKKQALLEFLDEILYNCKIENTKDSFMTLGENLSETEVKNLIDHGQSTYLLEGKSDVCYIIMKIDNQSNYIYRNIIQPILDEYGLQSMRADQIPQSGSITNEIRKNIIKSKLIICDLTFRTDNIMFELGIAVENNKDIILLSQNSKDIPESISERLILYYENNSTGLNDLSIKLNEAIQNALFSVPLIKIEKLIKDKKYDLSIIQTFSYIQTLLNTISRKIRDFPRGFNIFEETVKILGNENILSHEDIKQLKNLRVIRNKITHGERIENPNSKEISFQCLDLLKRLNSLNKYLDPIVNWINHLSGNDKNILINQFLKELKKESESIVGFGINPVFCNPVEIFKLTKLEAFSEKLLPALFRVLEVKEYVIYNKSDNQISLTSKGLEHVTKLEDKLF